MEGKLIYIFGIDGSGKTTLVKNLEKYFIENTVFLQTFSEPYYTTELENAANKLNASKRSIFSQQLRSCTWMLDLVRTTNEIIIPNLLNGQNVIVDRYALCNRVYLEILNHEQINYMGQILNCLPSPSLGFYLDISVEKAMHRIQLRNKQIAPYEKIDLLEKLKDRYEKYINIENYPIYVMDANKSELEICSSVLSHINEHKGGHRG